MDVPVGHPVGVPVDCLPVGVDVVALSEDARRRFQIDLERETQAAIRRVQNTLNTLEAREAREAQRRRAALDGAVEQAQSRISDAVQVNLDAQVHTAAAPPVCTLHARLQSTRRTRLSTFTPPSPPACAPHAPLNLDAQVGPALRLHLEQSAAASDAVRDVAFTLEARAATHAAEVVSKVASDSAITKAIEAKLMARVDERTRTNIWSVASPLFSAGAAILLYRFWDGKRNDRR